MRKAVPLNRKRAKETTHPGLEALACALGRQTAREYFESEQRLRALSTKGPVEPVDSEESPESTL